MTPAPTPAPRTTKPSAQRRAEILDAALHLFTTKGVQATSVEDIMRAVGIAKGTLYYHFRSKDEILHALIARTIDQTVARARAVVDGPGDTTHTFLGVVATMRVETSERELAHAFHGPESTELHLLSIVEMVRAMTPILTEVVERGVAEGVFSTEHPREVVELLLVGAGMLLDDGIFSGDSEQLARRTAGIVDAAEVLLGCRHGSLSSLIEGAS
ncbi:TetR/AcrR family transcriptional regulator [Actinomyces respiraculi]|uniref:TetR/AcrR family transcriptional regulator n=1 Tax=Actinomyces respiraculi TaxID=2744574 RepID=UPI00141EE8E1|nr:TetR/AcrR family transcriptional regulator [Actinomyces respiraculi]